MLRKICPIVFLLLVFIFPNKAFGVSININSYPSSISSDPFNVGLTISGASEGQNYLRVDLYKDGTSNYFGETNGGSGWYGGSEGKQYFPITVDPSKTASGSVQARIGVPKSGEFTGSGNYKLRIRRYTSSGNLASSDQQSPVNVMIAYSLPSTPAPSSKPAPTSKSTSASPTKASLSSVLTSNSQGTKDTSVGDSSEKSEAMPTSVLGEATKSASPSLKKEDKDVKILGQSGSKIPLFLLIGAGILGVCAILSFLLFRRRGKAENAE